MFGPQGCYRNFQLTFFLYFSLVCRLIHPYRLSNNLQVDIIGYKFRTFKVEPVGAGFSLCPHYTISFGFLPSCPSNLTAGLWTVPFRRFADLIKGNQKARLNALAVLGLAFSLSLFASRRRTPNAARTHCLAALPAGWCVALRAPL